MKIIDLLNKIANNEEVPGKIKVDNIIYIYESWEHFYYTDNEAREDLLIRGKDYSTNDFLNWNVELIEDNTIDIESINELLVEQLKNREHTNADIYAIAEQQNKILQVLKQQEKRIKKLENKEYCQVCGVELTEENKYMKNMCYDCKYGEE